MPKEIPQYIIIDGEKVINPVWTGKKYNEEHPITPIQKKRSSEGTLPSISNTGEHPGPQPGSDEQWNISQINNDN